MLKNIQARAYKKKSVVIVISALVGLTILGVGYFAWSTLHHQARLRAIAENEKKCDETILPLIDMLVEVKESDIGYMPTVSGDKFLPIDDEGRIGPLILGGPPPVESLALLELVRKGTEAVPCLIAHLDDGRETELVLKHSGVFGGMFFADEYDYNTQTNRPPVSGLNDDEGWGYFLPGSLESGQVYTVTVGDLCYVALGQIVNRRFNAARYQPTMIIIINSPAHSSELFRAVKYEWGTLTPEAHRASLIRDILQPDYPDRRTNAVKRLRFYYPDIAEEIDKEQSLE